MIKNLQKFGNSRGIVIEKTILKLLNMSDEGKFDLVLKDGGIFLKPIGVAEIYEKKAEKHRKSLDKLAE